LGQTDAVDVGQLLNSRYRLTGRLGEGGMSVVWRAHDEVLGRAVAVKVLAGQFAADPAWRRRIRLEARAAARLSHPNVTNVYDYGETADHSPFVVMELLRGPTLARCLETGPLAPAAAIRICAEVAAGLAAAHAEDLVHRDVKPANVVLTADAAKVVDFGIVGFAGDPGNPDPAAPVLGTPAYLAPERLRSDEVTPASDVYAFGLLLYRCLTGHLPWDTETTTQMVLAHVEVAPEPLPEIAGVTPDVRQLCMGCLAKEPADRPAAVEVASALAQAAGMVPRFSSVPPVPPPPTGRPWAEGATELIGDDHGERRRVLLGLTVVIAIAALLVTFVLSRPTSTPQASAEAATGTPGISGQSPPGGPAAPAGTDAGQSTAPTAIATTGGDVGNGGGSQSDEDGGGNQGGVDNPADNQGNSVRLPTFGGVIVAVCAGKKVNVLQLLPATGSKVVKVDQGARSKSRVEFERSGVRLRFQVSCPAGAPIAVPD
jgi:serine/threonine protein kinase